jgi:hypothetical protein
VARAIETHGETHLLLLTAAEYDALKRMIDRDPPTLPDALEDLHNLLCRYEDDEVDVG